MMWLRVYWGVSRTFFYEILVAAGVECSSRIVEVASFREQEIYLLRFACPVPRPQNGDVDAVSE